ncbi:MAG: cobaltochelatase subunit CobN [Nitratireductor sp.]
MWQSGSSQPVATISIHPRAITHLILCRRTDIFAFYAYLRKVFGAHAVVHMGKHGNMECYPARRSPCRRIVTPKRFSGDAASLPFHCQ